MKASVIIASWNRKKDTLQTLSSLSKSLIKDFQLEIIVVENGSTDGSPAAIRDFFKEINAPPKILTKLIANKENVGFAEGNNIGMRYALRNGSDFIILLNDDTIVDKRLISQLIKESSKYDQAGILSPKIYFAKGYEFHKDRYQKKDLGQVIWSAGGDIDWDNIYATNHGVDEVDKGQFDKIHEIDFATGCCVLIKRRIIEKVGLFDPRYFAYFEDADFAQRVKNAGWQVIFIPNAHLWHKVSQSSGIGSNLNDYFITRNRMLFGLRYAKLRTKIALIRESLKLLLIGRRWQKIGIRDFYLGKVGRGSWPKR